MSLEVADEFVIVEREISDVIVDLGGRVDGGVLGVREADQGHAVLLRVDEAFLHALLAIENDDLVILGAGDEIQPIRGIVDRFKFGIILLEGFGNAEAL